MTIAQPSQPVSALAARAASQSARSLSRAWAAALVVSVASGIGVHVLLDARGTEAARAARFQSSARVARAAYIQALRDEQTIAATMRRLSVQQRALPKGVAQAALIDDVSTLATKAGVVIQSLTLSPGGAIPGVTALPTLAHSVMQVQAKGTTTAAEAFVEQLDHIPRLVAVTAASISPSRAGTLASVTVVVYQRNSTTSTKTKAGAR